ncbi:MAG: GNAT family N-acetyltransferase [Thalassobaculum sp.]
MTDAPDVTLRPITVEDSADLLAWRNDPLTRGNSRNPDAVTQQEHAAWLSRVTADPNWRVWIGVEGGVPVGTTSALRDDGGTVEISVTVAPAARGHGLAAVLVRLAVARAREIWPDARIRAEIKPDNRASRKAFESCGFVETEAHDGLLDYEFRG